MYLGNEYQDLQVLPYTLGRLNHHLEDESHHLEDEYQHLEHEFKHLEDEPSVPRMIVSTWKMNTNT